MNANKANDSQPAMTFFYRVGGTNYKVRLFFSETATETMEDKILRLVRTAEAPFAPNTSRPSERSA